MSCRRLQRWKKIFRFAVTDYSTFTPYVFSGNSKTEIGEQETVVGKQGIDKSRVKVGFTIENVLSHRTSKDIQYSLNEMKVI